LNSCTISINVVNIKYFAKIFFKEIIIKGVSLFSSAGIGETYLEDIGIFIEVANELLPQRADLFRKLNPQKTMVVGDITNSEVFNNILEKSGDNIDFLLATPPCQGVSVAGSNRTVEKMKDDERNYLINKVIEFIKIKTPKYVLIENVPAYLKLCLPYKGELTGILDILKNELGDIYIIESDVLDASNFGTAQKRKRSMIKIYKKGLNWGWPQPSLPILTVEDVIGKLPSLESAETSPIPWHFARKHIGRHIMCMKHTPTGKSAFSNEKHYPKKESGERIKGYLSTFRRINWDEPAPTITMRNDAISSQRNVHPGRKQVDGKYSDARVLTPLELILLTGLPKKWPIPSDTPENLIRQCLGECVPPLLIKSVVGCINV
jgi:DNA (cytosine-5)-methyltransferase 1